MRHDSVIQAAMRRGRNLVITVAAAALVLGFAPAARARPPASLVPAIACHPILARAGTTFSITLTSNRTTGYSWALEDPLNETIVSYRGKRYMAPGTTMMGAPGWEIWTFSALRRGKALVSLKYARPWEKSAPPAKEAVFVVVVR
jgi:inhibitor of cysteine peptidase